MRSMLRVVGSVLVLGLLATVLWAMPVGAAPFAYVAHECSGSVSAIATATNTVVATIPVPDSLPFGVAITPNGASVYVTNVGGSVSVIATATNTITHGITTESVLCVGSVSTCWASMNGHLWDAARFGGTEFCTESAAWHPRPEGHT
jgi:YVTN family beta-propeller protein